MDNGKAILKPLNIEIRELGRRNLRSICHLLLPSIRIKSIDSGSTSSSPVVVFTSMGKYDIMNAIVIFEETPRPNQITSVGAIADFGKEFKAAKSGYSVDLRYLNDTSKMAVSTPTLAPKANPATLSKSVVRLAANS